MNVLEMRHRAAEAGRFLKTLGSGHRLLILCSLTEGEKTVGELERLLELRQPHLSQHLTRLRADGLVKTRRASRNVYYSLASEPAARVVGLLYELFCAEGATPGAGSGGTPSGSGDRAPEGQEGLGGRAGPAALDPSPPPPGGAATRR